ncbi:MAG: DNA adenine methylase [Terracidiphilus sp.]
MSQSDPTKRGQLIYFTPLRYPGGKAKLAGYVKSILEENRLLDGEYVEPYAGGAGIALELLFHEYVSCIHINDVSKPVHAFWKSVLDHTEEFCRLVVKTPLTVAAWDKQKRILSHPLQHETVELGFATFFLNRTNRSGILNGGIIGGRDQTGPWKIDARYNAKELVCRIEAISKLRDRIKLTRQDALKFLKSGASKWPKQTLIYLDPPYYVKGRDLYLDFYEHGDHEKVAEFMKGKTDGQQWIVSYDNVPAIRQLYTGARHIVYDIGYSARSASQGSEVMFFSKDLRVPPINGPIKITEDHAGIIQRRA